MKILSTIHRKKKKEAFTITEVVIATMIFTLAMAGVFASISQLRQPAAESTQEVTAAFFGKWVLDDLRRQVSADTWNNGILANGSTGTITNTIDGRTYNATYFVVDDPGTNARQVTLNVTW